MDEPETEELRLDQARRERDEREQAAGAELTGDERQHERRADKAAYLEAKLAERAESEERVDPDP